MHMFNTFCRSRSRTEGCIEHEQNSEQKAWMAFSVARRSLVRSILFSLSLSLFSLPFLCFSAHFHPLKGLPLRGRTKVAWWLERNVRLYIAPIGRTHNKVKTLKELCQCLLYVLKIYHKRTRLASKSVLHSIKHSQSILYKSPLY